MLIAVDFDGTCVTADFPKVGKNIGAQFVLKELSDLGHQIILNTNRGTDMGIFGNKLQDAINWFGEYNIPLYGVNKCIPTLKTNSPKLYADVYIDDLAYNAPLLYTLKYGHFFDWCHFVKHSGFFPSFKQRCQLIKRIKSEVNLLVYSINDSAIMQELLHNASFL